MRLDNASKVVAPRCKIADRVKAAEIRVALGSPRGVAMAGGPGRLSLDPLISGRVVSPDKPLSAYFDPSLADVRREADRYKRTFSHAPDHDPHIRVGGTNMRDDFARVWRNPAITPIGRTLGLLQVPAASLVMDLHRSTAYNPLSNTITTYNALPEVTRHELGHAADFTRFTRKEHPSFLSRLARDAYAAAPLTPVLASLAAAGFHAAGKEDYSARAAKAVPPLVLATGALSLFQEFEASRNAAKMTGDEPGSAQSKDEDMRRLWRRLAPALGTYVGGFGAEYLPDSMQSPLTPLLGLATGAAAGHGIAAIRNALVKRPERESNKQKNDTSGRSADAKPPTLRKAAASMSRGGVGVVALTSVCVAGDWVRLMEAR